MEETECLESYRAFIMRKQLEQSDAVIANEIFNEIENPEIITVLKYAKSSESDKRMVTLWEMAMVSFSFLLNLWKF